MHEATITSRGRVTIPKTIREKLNLNSGDKILFSVTEEDDIKIFTKTKSILDLRGILHRPGQKKITIKEMNEGIKQAAVKRYKRSLDK